MCNDIVAAILSFWRISIWRLKISAQCRRKSLNIQLLAKYSALHIHLNHQPSMAYCNVAASMAYQPA
jgi:hypothetical protein